jgi:plasmid replication initiation protein
MPPAQIDKFLYVRMSNLLIRAGHGLSLPEKRIVMLALSKLNKQKTNMGEMPTERVARIHATELAEVGNISVDVAYRELRDGQKKLYDRSITSCFDPVTGEEKDGFFRWVTRMHYQNKEGWIEAAFNPDVLPYICELEKEFTSYKLSRAGAFRSIYTWRLFELLMQFKHTGLLKISVEELHKALETPSVYQQNFYHLRKKIIAPAIEEIKEKDGLNVQWKPIKKGRRVELIEFSFPVEQQKVIPLSKKQKSVVKKAAVPTQSTDLEKAAELAHLKKLSELSGVPLKELLKKEDKATA